MKSDYFPALILICASLVLSLFAYAKVPDDTNQIGVIFPLTNSIQENINLANKANTPVVRLGFFTPIIVVEKKSEASILSLYQAGALAVFNPQILGNCLTSETDSKKL